MQRADPFDLDWYVDNVVVPSGIEREHVGPVRAWQGSWLASARKLRSLEDGSPEAAAAQLAVRQGFVVTKAQLRDCGVTDATVRRYLRRGLWTAAGHGTVALVPRSSVADLDGHELLRREHALRAAGAVLRRPGHVIGAASAAVAHGLPTMAVPAIPELLARDATTGRRDAAHVRVARDLLTAERWFGAPVSGVADTVADLARHDARSGLMAADAALHERILRPDELALAIERSAGLPGARRAREVLELVSPLIESPLESLTHLALHDAGFPPPELQVELRAAAGRRYRVDFFWPCLRLVLEADGRRKYQADELWREKNREVALLQAGYRVLRVRWADVIDDWPATAAWLAAVMANPLI